MSAHHWYFAYGSNVLIRQMHERTGPVRRLIRCELRGYRLAFNKDSERWGVAANIVEDRQTSVWGIAYSMDAASLLKMDDHEPGYRRSAVLVHTEARESLSAVTYVAEQVRTDLSPPAEYIRKILTGARQHGLPAHYISRIEQLAGLDAFE